MKRIMKIVTTALIICSIPFAALNAQEKKNEQRIKIVVTDKSGTKTELDTLLKDSSMPDSIKLKDGKVIHISKHDAMSGLIAHDGSPNEHMSVTVTSDNEGKGKIVKEVRIITGDSTKIIQDNAGEGVIIVKRGNHLTEGKAGDVMVWSSDDTGSNGERIIYINEGKGELKDGEKTYNIEVNTDDSGNKVENTKYVLAKDGMVISIEGNDEAKVKDLVKDIEAKLGVNKEGKTEKPVIKEETKKTVKK
jgi:hypothetical protein